MRVHGQLGCLLLIVGAACDLGASAPTRAPTGKLVPIPTARGSQSGEPSGVSISAQDGGTLTSADGAVTVTIPAGGAGDVLELSITPVANTARGGVGRAYRLGPEGTTFLKPVTITLRGPETYSAGTSFADLGVAYQDAAGYWHAVPAVARDPASHTVTVESTHFSDWTMTWQTDVAAAEGPITLDQTVGIPSDGTIIPLHATGRATLYPQGDDAYDTTYVLTGTLQVPGTFTVGSATCVPDQATKTLTPNVAEVHKSSPPVFRWGLGVSWTLSCDDGKTYEVPAQFDTMKIILTSCPAGYDLDPAQVVTAERLSGSYTTDCTASPPYAGTVSATWDLRACVANLPCSTGVDCRLGATACDAATAVQTCADAGPAADGTACGPTGAGLCSAGACVGG